MTQENNEVKKKSNPDYASSAVKLVNPPEVKGLLDEWVAAETVANEARSALDTVILAAATIELAKVDVANRLLKEARQNLEGAIKEFGGYQDVEAGEYALEQTRKQISYDPAEVKNLIPDYADKILIGVDNTVLKGLLRGKLITQEQVDGCTVTKEHTRFVLEVM